MIDKDTCGLLFQKYHRYVYKFCLKQLKNTHSAEDCTNEVFMIMLKKKNTIKLSKNLSSWLCETSKNVCKEYIRNNSIKFDDVDELAETIADSSVSLEKPLYDEIYEFLDREEADLFFEYINSSIAERRKMADRLKITPNALCKRIQKIKRKIQTNLTDDVRFCDFMNRHDG